MPNSDCTACVYLTLLVLQNNLTLNRLNHIWPLLFSQWWSADPRSMIYFVRFVCILFSAILSLVQSSSKWHMRSVSSKKTMKCALERRVLQISATRMIGSLERFVCSQLKPHYSSHYSMPAQQYIKQCDYVWVSLAHICRWLFKDNCFKCALSEFFKLLNQNSGGLFVL